jgi:ABC-2 type transport system permease protein
VIVAIRLLRDRRRSTLWWALGLVALVLFTVSLYPSVRGQASFDELIANLPEGVKVVIGYQAGVPLTSAPGYLQGRLFSTLAPVVMVVFGIGAGARAIGGSEEAGRLEPLLANPVSRTRVLFERYLATVALLFVLAAVFTAALLTLSAPVGALEGVSIAGLVGACAGVFGLALLHGTLAFAVGAATGRRTTATAVATTVAVAGYPARADRRPSAAAVPDAVALVPRAQHAGRRSRTRRRGDPHPRLRPALAHRLGRVRAPRSAVNGRRGSALLSWR